MTKVQVPDSIDDMIVQVPDSIDDMILGTHGVVSIVEETTDTHRTRIDGRLQRVLKIIESRLAKGAAQGPDHYGYSTFHMSRDGSPYWLFCSAFLPFNINTSIDDLREYEQDCGESTLITVLVVAFYKKGRTSQSIPENAFMRALVYVYRRYVMVVMLDHDQMPVGQVRFFRNDEDRKTLLRTSDIREMGAEVFDEVKSRVG